MTRRAQVVNWLLYYRRELRGVPIEELKRRREVRAAREAAQAGPHKKYFSQPNLSFCEASHKHYSRLNLRIFEV